MTFEGIGEGGIGLRDELEENLDPLDLRCRHIGLAGLEAPHEVGNDDLVGVVGDRLEDHPRRQLIARPGGAELKLLDLGHLTPHRHDLQAAVDRRPVVVVVVVIIIVVHFEPIELEAIDLDASRHAAARHLEDIGRVLGLLDFLEELQERDAGGLAVKERVGRDHVAEELHRLLVFGELEIRVDHRQGAARLKLLLFELLERLDHRGQLANRRESVAAEDEIDLFLESQRRRDERSVLGDHRHAPFERIGAAGGPRQRQAGEKREAQPVANTARGLRNGGGMADDGHRGSFRWERGGA